MNRGIPIVYRRALKAIGRSITHSVIPECGVARWAFDEGNGTTAVDDWGTNDGQINDASYSYDSVVGSHSLSFDGSGDYVNIKDSIALDITSDISLSIWVKTSNPNQGDNRLIDKSTDGTNEAYLLDLNSGCRLSLDAGEITTNSTIPPDLWTLVTATYDSSTELARIYYDNAMQVEEMLSGSITANNNPVRIGTSPTDSTKGYIGYLDDARIYNKSLSIEEVNNLYTTGSILG